MTKTPWLGRVALVALVAISFGCGKAAEKGIERSIESENGGDADVDLSDGNIQVSDGEGGTVEIDASGNASLPDGFPSDLEVAGTTNIIQASNSTTGDSQVQLVTLQFEGPVADAYEGYKVQLEAAGYEIESDSSGTNAGSDVGNAVATKGSTTVNATFGGDGQGNGTATVSVQVE